MYDIIKTAELSNYIHSRLKFSKVPICEILTADVFFTDKIEAIGIYAYCYKKIYYIKFFTGHKSEEETYAFYNEDDLTFSLVKFKIKQKAIKETRGHNYKEYALELLKDVDKDYYNRAVTAFDSKP